MTYKPYFLQYDGMLYHDIEAWIVKAFNEVFEGERLDSEAIVDSLIGSDADGIEWNDDYWSRQAMIERIDKLQKAKLEQTDT